MMTEVALGEARRTMKLACSSAFLPTEDYAEKLALAAHYGYAGIEVRLEESPALERQVAEIEEARAGSAIEVSSVVVRSPAYRASLVSDQALQAKLASARVALAVGARLGGGVILQAEYQAQDPLPSIGPLPSPSAQEAELLHCYLNEVAAYAERVSAVALIEPLNRYESHFYHRLEDAYLLCEGVGSSRLGICADFFHMNLEEPDIAESIIATGKRIYHVQLADSNRLLPGLGHLDFRAGFAALHAIGYERYMSLECIIPSDPEHDLPRCAGYLCQCIDKSGRATA
jgi:sugar phosphate isomerase/epimerase